MSDDPRRPPTSHSIEALLDEQTGNTKDVMALVGHVGPGRGDDVRLYSDRRHGSDGWTSRSTRSPTMRPLRTSSPAWSSRARASCGSSASG